jgi:hypothetical protein
MAKHASEPTTEQRIEEFAEDLGRLLGTARAKAEGWIDQRQQVAKHLAEIRDTASHLLQQLAQAAVGLTRRRGRPAGSGRGPARQAKGGPGRPKSSGRKRRTMSPEARAKIAAAQKKRWAAVRAAQKK